MKVGKKTIMFLVLGVVGLYMLYQVGYWMIYMPWASRFKTERELAEQIRLATASANRLDGLKRQWQELGSLTYGVDRGQMIDNMNIYLDGVMRGIHGGRSLEVEGSTKLVTIKPPKTQPKQGSIEVQADLLGVGRIDACFRVLHELAQTPYLGRVENARIEKVPGGTYRLRAEYIAKWLDQPTVNNQKLKFELADQSAAVKRIRYSGSQYKLSDTTMFTQYEPPVVATRDERPRQTPPATQPKDPPPIVKVVDKPRDPPYSKLAISAVYSATADDPEHVTVYDHGSTRTWDVRLGGELAGGTLAAINVVDAYVVWRVDGKDYVVEVRPGRRLSDRVPREEYKQMPSFEQYQQE